MTSGWGNNTNLEAALIMILNKGIEYGVSPDEMPENLIIISDMEIDQCTDKSWNFYDGIERMFWKHGYKIPNVVFWNVCSRHNTFLADSKRKGVQLISGSAISSFKHLIENINSTPIQLMEKVIGSDRYSGIR